MHPLISFPLTLLWPVLPWISLSPWWVEKFGTATTLTVMAVAGLVTDFWWGKTLGGGSLLLIGLVPLIHWGRSVWPASQRSFSLLSLVVSLVLFEVYLLWL